MAVDLICPDCGGIIGGGVDADGRGPCTCARNISMNGGPRDDSSDTVSIPAQPKTESGDNLLTGSAAPAESAKRCIKCGKDVTGHRRVKDSRGYMCYACAKAEIHEEKAGTIPCATCKRRIKEAGLVEYKGRRICKICLDHEKEVDRRNKKVATEAIDEHEKRNVIILAIIFGVLAIIVIMQTIRYLLGK
jgi:hypothetical protein